MAQRTPWLRYPVTPVPAPAPRLGAGRLRPVRPPRDRVDRILAWLQGLAFLAFLVSLGIWGYQRWTGTQDLQPVPRGPQVGIALGIGPGEGAAPTAVPAPEGSAAPLSVPLPYVRERPPRRTDAAAAVPTPAPTPTPNLGQRYQPPTRLVIPRIDLDSPVVEVGIVDGAWEVAKYAVGHHLGTALPGQPGNLVLSGHRGLYGAPFKRLPELKIGDEILVYDALGRVFRYRVAQMVEVWPTQVEVMYPTRDPTITLITCTEYDTKRLVVRGVLEGQAPRLGAP